MANVKPIFLEPEYDSEWKVASGVSLETVKEAIHLYPEAKSIILTYPNYYGMVYDLQGVIQHAHQHRIPVLVDEAHGAHFIASPIFPSSAVQMGADIVVQSAHKTLPAMTMGSFLHVNSDLVNINRLMDYLQILQSSSPSYPIMASLDLARSYLAAYGEKDIRYLSSKIKQFKEELAEITAIKVLEYPNSQGDLLKVTIQSMCGLSGFELQRRLERVGIYTELADPNNVLLIMPLLKESQSYPFKDTVIKMKSELASQSIQHAIEELPVTGQKISELAIPYKEMEHYKEKQVVIADVINLVCAETVIPYPPGIPLLLRGERITMEKIKYLKELLQVGGRFQGGASLEQGLLKVFLED
jgi:arginine/lysine/ornithine decarboxylase